MPRVVAVPPSFAAYLRKSLCFQWLERGLARAGTTWHAFRNKTIERR
jgi:hypothetical protein